MHMPIAEHSSLRLQSQVEHAQSPAVNSGLGALPERQREGQLPSVCLLSLTFCLSLPGQFPPPSAAQPTSSLKLQPLQAAEDRWPFSIQMLATTSA